MQRLDIEYILQFKEQEIKLPVIDYRKGNLFLRCYSDKNKKRHLLGKFLESKMSHAGIIGELIAKLEKEDLALGRRLIYYMEGLLAAFSADIQKEPYSAAFYKSLSVDVRQLLELISSAENPHVVLYNRLNNLLIGEMPSSPAGQGCCRDMRGLMNALKESADIMCAYHDVFTNLVQQESEKRGKMLVTSRVGQRLYKLSLVVESLIVATGCTYTRMAEWQKQVRRVQKQEIYN
ncbi:MAG: hypothetical protein J0H74_32690 [Chitinophagaceae bacterium]|nr:hypothetical protein [Chitinophagaceae bacterium]